jgi:nitrogen fixation/metabolism regulation signal transduction histidine kinase
MSEPSPTSTATAASQASPPSGPYKRSVKNYLIDSRFQLKYTGFIVGVALAISLLLGAVVVYTTDEVVGESQKVNEEGKKVVAESRKVSDVVKMSIKDNYADDPELAKTFAQASNQADDTLNAQEAALVSEQQNLVQRQRRMLEALVGSLVVMVILIGLLGIYFTHKVAGPVYKMKMLLKNVQRGKLVVPPGKLRKGDELQDFFDAFAEMVRELRRRQQDEVDDLGKAIEAARGAGASEAVVSKIEAVRDTMSRALDA